MTNQTWQALGIAFASPHPLHIPVLPATAAPSFLYERSSVPLWSPGDWEGASFIASAGPPVTDNPDPDLMVEVRRLGESFLWCLPHGCTLRLDPDLATTHAPDPALEPSLEMEFLELGLGLQLSLRGSLVLHGAAIAIEGCAVALLAPSGGGKSTLTVAAVQAGHPFLSDDLVAIHEPDRLVFPGHLCLRMHRQTGDALLAGSLVHPLNPARERTKHYTSVPEWGPIQETPLPLAAIYIVHSDSAFESPSIAPISPLHAIPAFLAAQVGLDPRPPGTRLAAFAALAGQVPLRTLQFPRRFDALPGAVELLVRDFRTLRAKDPAQSSPRI